MAATGFLFGDTFDYYATANILEKWTGIDIQEGSTNFSISASAHRNGPYGLKRSLLQNTLGTLLFKTLNPGDPTTICVNIAFQYTVAVDVYSALWMIRDDATVQGALLLRPDGKLVYCAGANTPGHLFTEYIVATSVTTQALLAGNFYNIKLLVNLATGTGGRVRIWVNSVVGSDASGFNSAPSGVAQWTNTGPGNKGFIPSGGGWGGTVGDYYYDDVRVRDNDNGIFDSIGIALHALTGNGAHTDYTPFTGSDHGAMVLDVLEDSDTTYNQATAVNQKDTYVMQDLPEPATIECVQTVEVCRKTDAGDRLCANIIRIGSTDYVGAQYAPNQTYSHCLTPMDKSPATSITWTDTEINAMESGQKITL